MSEKVKRTKEEFLRNFMADDADKALERVENEQIVEPKDTNHEQEINKEGGEKS